MTDPSAAAAPGDHPGGHPGDHPGDNPGGDQGGDELLARISAAGRSIGGVGDGPLAEAVTRLDTLHRELQGALAELDRA